VLKGYFLCSIVGRVGSVRGGVGQGSGVRIGAVRAVGTVGRGVCYGGCGVGQGGAVASYEGVRRGLGVGESQQGGKEEQLEHFEFVDIF